MLPTSRPRVGSSSTRTQLAAELAGDDGLLLVAARRRPRRAQSADGVRMPNSARFPHFGAGVDGRRRCAGFRARRAARRNWVSDEVVLDGETKSARPNRWRSPGHERHAGSLEVARTPPRVTLRPSQFDGAAHRLSPGGRAPRRARPGRCRRHPAMPRISPARTSKLTPLTASCTAVVERLQVRHRQSRGSVRCNSPRSTIELGRCGRPSALRDRPRRSRLGPRAHHFAAPNDRDPVGDLEDLVQLVADEDDRVTLGGQAPEDLEDFLGSPAV